VFLCFCSHTHPFLRSGHARCLTEQLPLQGLALINWETDAGAKVGLKVSFCFPLLRLLSCEGWQFSRHTRTRTCLQVLTPSGTVLHEVAPTVRDHVGFQVRPGFCEASFHPPKKTNARTCTCVHFHLSQAKEAGDYQACFEAAPPTDSVQPADKDKSAEKTEGDAAAGGESNATQGEGEHGGEQEQQQQVVSEPSPPSGAPGMERSACLPVPN